MKYKQAIYYICFLGFFSHYCVSYYVTNLIKKLELHLLVTFIFNESKIWNLGFKRN